MEDIEEISRIAILNGFIKQKRNSEFKTFFLSNTNEPSSFEIRNSMLLHTAALFNNLEIIAFLFSLGHDLNVRNRLGQTPLLLAIVHERFQTVQNLLSLDADIFAADVEGTSPLQLCFQRERNVPEYIITCLFETLKRLGLSAEQMAREVTKAGCNIDQVLLMRDADVTGLMLDNTVSFIQSESRALLTRAINLKYLDNVRILLNRGPEWDERCEMFWEIVVKGRLVPTIKPFFDQLVNWKIPRTHHLKRLSFMFVNENQEFIEMFLKIDIDKYARDKLGWELIVNSFYNNRVDYIKVLQDREFNVNGLDPSGRWGALHLAARCRNERGVIYLLNNGADPDIRDYEGKTPLFHECNNVIFDLLVDAGADLQIVDNNGQTVLDAGIQYLIIPRIAILEAKGIPIISRIRYLIDNDQVLSRSYYESHLMHCEWTKTYQITKSVTLFSVFTDKVETVADYIKKEEDFRAIKFSLHRHGIKWIYACILLTKIKNALKIHELRPKASLFISMMIGVIQPDNLVIIQIIRHITYRHLLVFDLIDTTDVT